MGGRGLHRQRTESLCGGEGACGVVARFDRMDVVVHEANVVRMATQSAFQYRDELRRIRSGLAVHRPKPPRSQVHDGFGVESGCIWIVRMFGDQCAHGLPVSHGELVKVRTGCSAIACAQGVDVLALQRRRA